jgi:hypothetical protein
MLFANTIWEKIKHTTTTVGKVIGIYILVSLSLPLSISDSFIVFMILTSKNYLPLVTTNLAIAINFMPETCH